MKNYGKDNESSCVMYLDVNNLYGRAMSQVLLVNSFKWKKHTYIQEKKNVSKSKEFIKNYVDNRCKGYILEADVEYSKNICDWDNDLPFSQGRIKIKKCHKLVCNLHDKTKYAVHVRTLTQALNYGLIF